jgi:hypothetical protein
VRSTPLPRLVHERGAWIDLDGDPVPELTARYLDRYFGALAQARGETWPPDDDGGDAAHVREPRRPYPNGGAMVAEVDEPERSGS